MSDDTLSRHIKALQDARSAHRSLCSALCVDDGLYRRHKGALESLKMELDAACARLLLRQSDLGASSAVHGRPQGA